MARWSGSERRTAWSWRKDSTRAMGAWSRGSRVAETLKMSEKRARLAYYCSGGRSGEGKSCSEQSTEQRPRHTLPGPAEAQAEGRTIAHGTSSWPSHTGILVSRDGCVFKKVAPAGGGLRKFPPRRNPVASLLEPWSRACTTGASALLGLFLPTHATLLSSSSTREPPDMTRATVPTPGIVT